MTPRFNIDDEILWISDNSDGLEKALFASDVMKCLGITEFTKAIWNSGCWLRNALRELGADEEEIKRIQFSHGQRCFSRDPYDVALAYANEYAETKTTKDQPGFELGKTILQEAFAAE